MISFSLQNHPHPCYFHKNIQCVSTPQCCLPSLLFLYCLTPPTFKEDGLHVFALVISRPRLSLCLALLLPSILSHFPFKFLYFPSVDLQIQSLLWSVLTIILLMFLMLPLLKHHTIRWHMPKRSIFKDQYLYTMPYVCTGDVYGVQQLNMYG